MHDRRARDADIIRNKAPKLFGRLLRILLKRAGITQEELEARATYYRDMWADQGYYEKTDSGDLTQSSISKVINDKWLPAYGQVFLWLYALEDALKANGSEFPADLRRDMFLLVRYVPPDEILDAYERRKDEI